MHIALDPSENLEANLPLGDAREAVLLGSLRIAASGRPGASTLLTGKRRTPDILNGQSEGQLRPKS